VCIFRGYIKAQVQLLTPLVIFFYIKFEKTKIERDIFVFFRKYLLFLFFCFVFFCVKKKRVRIKTKQKIELIYKEHEKIIL